MFYVVKSVENGNDVIIEEFTNYEAASRDAFFRTGQARGVVDFYVTESVSDEMKIEFLTSGNPWWVREYEK
jgi:hypothetical protein